MKGDLDLNSFKASVNPGMTIYICGSVIQDAVCMKPKTVPLRDDRTASCSILIRW